MLIFLLLIFSELILREKNRSGEGRNVNATTRKEVTTSSLHKNLFGVDVNTQGGKTDVERRAAALAQLEARLKVI